MTDTQSTSDDPDVAHELQEIGEEFGCQRLQGENTDAYGLRLLEYIAEMGSEIRGVEARVRDLMASSDLAQ